MNFIMEKALGFILGTLVVIYLATHVLGIGFTSSGGFTSSNTSLTKTATKTTSCFDQIGKSNLSANCKSITIGGTKIG